MKKLILLFVISLGLTSCYVDVNKSVTNSAKETTSYLQNLPKDTTVNVAYESHSIYVFDRKSNQLLYKADSIEDASKPMNIYSLVWFAILIFLLGLAIGSTFN